MPKKFLPNGVPLPQTTAFKNLNLRIISCIKTKCADSWWRVTCIWWADRIAIRSKLTDLNMVPANSRPSQIWLSNLKMDDVPLLILETEQCCAVLSTVRKVVTSTKQQELQLQLAPHSKTTRQVSFLKIFRRSPTPWYQHGLIPSEWGTYKSRHQHRELGTNIKYQSPTSHSAVLWCWCSMSVP